MNYLIVSETRGMGLFATLNTLYALFTNTFCSNDSIQVVNKVRRRSTIACNFRSNIHLGPGLQCLLKFKVDLKLRTESLAYENGHLEITEIKTI